MGVHDRPAPSHRSRTPTVAVTRERPTDDEVLSAVRAADDPEEDTLAGVAGDEAARRIVELLPPQQAEIVLLRVVAGLDVAAVAEITGRRPGTVRVMQHRALKSLARALGDDDR